MISVIMPVYNGGKHLKEAIESILNQTYSDFEFFIINDGSSDQSEEIILSYADTRIRYVLNEKNLGIVKTLNRGIELSTAKYIVRMDADDISLPHRLERQVAFMETNPELVASGTNILRFYNDDISRTNPSMVDLDDGSLRIKSIFYTAFWHPTMIIRNDVLKAHNLSYRADFKYSQDKALWIALSLHGAIANLEEALLYYRVHENQVSTKHFAEQYVISMAITREALINLGVPMDRFNNKTIGFIAYPQRCYDVKELYEVDKFIAEIVTALHMDPKYDQETVLRFLKEQLIKTLHKSLNIGMSLLYFIHRSNFLNIQDFDLKFFVKAILKRNTKSSV
ncbi:glycosyltransferase family 2 protein [Anditalea andensis]|uniref:Glycosyltransferase 2-like domain-containing protein n=1 Tax=Anditalea andensis TaxID=1048983 RepID=A0A074LFR8_9BACT|nr:glycosyltransferase [Anditalea andensis]KEO72602.1 hypothetical protein EL17_17850 [Anditalea andensis]